MMGTLAYSANVSTSACAKVRIMIPCTYRSSTRAVSAIGSPRPSWTSRGERKCAVPPNWVTPTSKDTRVRVEDFMKIMANAFPDSGLPA